MRTKLSVCRRKRRFAFAHDAHLFARAAALALHAYRCDRCGWFHLTSRTKGKWTPLYRDRDDDGYRPPADAKGSASSLQSGRRYGSFEAVPVATASSTVA